MHVGVPKEIKIHEYRVGLTPPSVAELTASGHEVTVETGAGSGIDFTDDDYVAAGATIAPDAAAVFAAADMIVKVKEPQPGECAMLAPGPGAVHLSPPRPRPRAGEGADAAGATCIAYETVTDRGRRPAAAQPDVGGRRPDVGPGRRALSREGTGRPRHPARRRARRRAGARSRSSAAASRASTRRRWRSACAPTSRSTTSRPRASPRSTRCSRAGSRPCSAARRRSRRRSPAPTSSSARC